MSGTYEINRVPLRLLFSLIAHVHADGVQHMPREGGVVLVSNHLSMLDPLLLGVLFARQLHFMTKEELFRIAPLGWYLRNAGSFAVRRGETDRAALHQAEELLRAGRVVMVFPEGHRSKAGGAQAARAGAVLLATRTGSPILPAALTGTEHLTLHRPAGEIARGFLSRPTISVRVGEPLWLDAGRGGLTRKANAALVMHRIIELLPSAYHGIYADE